MLMRLPRWRTQMNCIAKAKCTMTVRVLSGIIPEAFKWFKKAAELGNADAQYELCKTYRYGQGVERNNYEAEKWLRKSNDHKQSPYDLDIHLF